MPFECEAARGVPSGTRGVPRPSGIVDEILDLYVRDGYVYYRALKVEHARFDRHVGSLASVAVDRLSRDEQFQLAYAPFDWSLNDLTGHGGQ